jgi:hypothetical protein
MKAMIQFTDFYDDIGFMVALFYTDMLNNADIYEIANHLTNKVSDDNLANIIVNGTDDDNNKKLFENYLNKLKIKLLNPKRALIAKVFYYILHNRIDLRKGIKFANFEVSNNENITKYVGDDVGIEQILGNYYAIADGDIKDKKDIEATKKLILEELQQYVHDNLEHIEKIKDEEVIQGQKQTKQHHGFVTFWLWLTIIGAGMECYMQCHLNLVENIRIIV